MTELCIQYGVRCVDLAGLGRNFYRGSHPLDDDPGKMNGKEPRMSTANVAVGLVRDGGLDDGAEVHVAQGKAELQSSDRLESNVRTGIFV